MVVCVVHPGYIVVVVFNAAVGAVHRSRVASRRGALVFGRTLLLESDAMSVGVEVCFAGTCSILTAVAAFKLYFR